MKKPLLILFLCIMLFLSNIQYSIAQCAICARTVAQMGDKPAHGFNSGILYLMLVPFVLIGVIGYRWWKSNKDPIGE